MSQKFFGRDFEKLATAIREWTDAVRAIPIPESYDPGTISPPSIDFSWAGGPSPVDPIPPLNDVEQVPFELPLLEIFQMGFAKAFATRNDAGAIAKSDTNFFYQHAEWQNEIARFKAECREGAHAIHDYIYEHRPPLIDVEPTLSAISLAESKIAAVLDAWSEVHKFAPRGTGSTRRHYSEPPKQKFFGKDFEAIQIALDALQASLSIIPEPSGLIPPEAPDDDTESQSDTGPSMDGLWSHLADDGPWFVNQYHSIDPETGFEFVHHEFSETAGVEVVCVVVIVALWGDNMTPGGNGWLGVDSESWAGTMPKVTWDLSLQFVEDFWRAYQETLYSFIEGELNVTVQNLSTENAIYAAKNSAAALDSAFAENVQPWRKGWF